jgi:hypothetical protein
MCGANGEIITMSASMARAAPDRLRPLGAADRRFAPPGARAPCLR